MNFEFGFNYLRLLEVVKMVSFQHKKEEKERLSRVGEWSEHVSSSGKKYYYNCQTEVSQWEKPGVWLEWERSHRQVPSVSQNMNKDSMSISSVHRSQHDKNRQGL